MIAGWDKRVSDSYVYLPFSKAVGFVCMGTWLVKEIF